MLVKDFTTTINITILFGQSTYIETHQYTLYGSNSAHGSNIDTSNNPQAFKQLKFIDSLKELNGN
jgi:hypothetical protein